MEKLNNKHLLLIVMAIGSYMFFRSRKVTPLQGDDLNNDSFVSDLTTGQGEEEKPRTMEIRAKAKRAFPYSKERRSNLNKGENLIEEYKKAS